jgi:hypothetical protein
MSDLFDVRFLCRISDLLISDFYGGFVLALTELYRKLSQIARAPYYLVGVPIVLVGAPMFLQGALMG